MTDRDRPTVDIEDLVGDAQGVAAVDHLYRKRLVQLPEVYVIH